MYCDSFEGSGAGSSGALGAGGRFATWLGQGCGTATCCGGSVDELADQIWVAIPAGGAGLIGARFLGHMLGAEVVPPGAAASFSCNARSSDPFTMRVKSLGPDVAGVRATGATLVALSPTAGRTVGFDVALGATGFGKLIASST